MMIQVGGKGSICGRYLTENTVAYINYIKIQNPEKYISASGGIITPQDAQRVIKSGADSIQLCSTIYLHGFQRIKQIKEVIPK
jgi:dihydroorotate dehydrogenase